MTGAGSGGRAPPDGMDAEEAERCPICLGVLARDELAMPDSCCHVFCLRCLLTWAELQVSPSCPVDRRPFTNVYRWDGELSVQVSVKRPPTQPESDSCCCKNPEQKVCLKKKPERRIRRQKAEAAADIKLKGLVRKCNEEDSSSLTRKKMRGIECCVWSPSSCVSVAVSTQDVVWVTEDLPSDTGLRECKAQVQECTWLSLAAPADGVLRQHFSPISWNRSSFSFGHPSSPFTSSTVLGPDHFVFQGVVCAITCPKGGEKRGGRASTSKAPAKEAESLPSRRSGRNSKTQEEAPLSDASSPPQSNSSDCDSSTNQSTTAGKTSPMPARKKGKQVTNRKASGKRKAPARKRSSPEVSDSPSASEEEAAGGDDGDEAQNPSGSDPQPSDAEESLDADPNDSADEQGGVDSLSNSVAQDSSSDTQEQSRTHVEEDNEGRELSCPADSAANSPSSWSGGSQSKGEEQEPASPVSSRGKESDERNSPVPSDCQSALTENPLSPHFNQQTEQDDNMDICTESEEANSDHSSREMKADSFENLAQPSSPSPENVTDPDTKCPEGPDVPALGSQESLAEEGTKDEGQSKDDAKVVPMDCSSPMSEHEKSPLLEPPSDNGDAAATQLPSAQLLTKDEGSKDQDEREKSPERKNGRQRRSRFHSPTSTWSPKRDSRRDSSRRSNSRSRERDGSPPSSRSSRARSRERGRERDSNREHSRRDRSRERRRWRSRSRSRSRSHSRSRSRSRTRSYRRGASPEWQASREHSPPRKERRGGWRTGQGSGEGRRCHGGAGRFENGVPTESSPERQGWSENPDWVTEKTSGESEGRNRDSGLSGSSRWEEHRGRAEPRGQGGRGRGAGRGAGSRSFYSQQEETSDNRWQPRNSFSGTSNNSGNDSYSRFNENRGGGRRKESEQGDSMVDRSGWSSASSWAVRRTLPADVQDYYSKRERGGPGGWNRQEEEQQAAAGDPPKSEPQPQAVPGNAPVPVVTVIPPHPPQLNVLPHHYPGQGPRGALPVALQPAAPYAMPPQVPVHLHPAVPLFQMPAVGAQGLPPPPPPPPPMQQGSQTVAAQPEGHTTQMGTNIVGYGKPALLTKAGIAAMTQGQPAACQALPSSTTQPGHNKAQADSSKKEKKQQIQEKAINEVKTAIKPFYQKKEITKEEYKEIVRKAVEKVCHSKSGEVNASKVANLVKAYVDKYKHARKK